MLYRHMIIYVVLVTVYDFKKWNEWCFRPRSFSVRLYAGGENFESNIYSGSITHDSCSIVSSVICLRLHMLYW